VGGCAQTADGIGAYARPLRDDTALLRTIAASPSIQQALRELVGFDVAEKDIDFGAPVRLASGFGLEIVAADAAMGRFFLVDAGSEQWPVIYADSEGSAGLRLWSLTIRSPACACDGSGLRIDR
jgi:hypothetical protein